MLLQKQEFIYNRLRECQTAVKAKPVKSFWIHLCFHINLIILITTKQHLCSHLQGLNSVVALLCQEKNGNKYDKDLKMEIHPVTKDMHELGKHV